MQNPTTPTKGPKHRHIANAISARIISGDLPDGTKLRSRDELAAEYGVNPSTIRQALNVLRNSGMVNAKQGTGTFVTYTPKPETAPEPEPEVISEPDADRDVAYTPENTAAPDTADDSSTNEPDEKPTTFNIQVTQHDPELQAIEATLVLLQMLPYETRVRALTYIRDRIESDPNVWSPPTPPSTPPLEPVSRRQVAQVLAEADDRVWADMTPIGQSSYYRRADALNESFAVVQAAR